MLAKDLTARRWAKRGDTELIFPERRFGLVPDLDGTSGTDNTDAINRLAEYVNEYGGHVLLTGRYRITEGFPIYKGTWEFTDDALIRNTRVDMTDYWTNTCVFIGTYFGSGAGAAYFNGEPGYDIDPMAAGSASVVFSTAGDAANFPVGSLFFTFDRNDYGASGFPIASHASRVLVNNGSGTIVLRDPTPFAITANGGDKPQARTDAGTVTNTNPGVPTSGRFARDVRIINGAFESTNTIWSQVAHIACIDSDLDFRWLKGNSCFGMNPSMDSRISIHNSEFYKILGELAFHHHRIGSQVIRGRRIGAVNLNAIPAVAFSEYGNDVDVSLIDVSEPYMAGDPSRATVGVLSPRTRLGTVIVRDTGFMGVDFGASGTRAEGSSAQRIEVLKSGNIGVGIDSDEITIGHIEADNIDAAGKAVNISALSGENVVIDSARLGSGPDGGAQYRILDLRAVSKRKYLTKVRGHYTPERMDILNSGAISSTSTGVDRTIQTYTVPAGASGLRAGWRVRASGSIPASGNATARTVKVVVSLGGANVTLGTLTIASGGAATQFEIEGTVRKIGGHSVTKVSGSARNQTAGTVTAHGTLHTNSTTTNDLTINLIINTHTDDTINPYEFTIEPFGDEAEPS